MRRATLLYNPISGHRGHRISNIERVADALRLQRFDVSITATKGPQTAGTQAADADTDILFACGGDGTIHEVIQGLVHHPNTTLGIIPLGSANALARHLQLSMDPVKAALQQLNRKPAYIPLGYVTYQAPTGEQSRYFIVMAGAGPDGALVYRMLGGGKQHLGRTMYYLRAANLFWRTRFTAFPVSCTQTSGEATQRRSINAMAVRVGDLGGLFSPLMRGGELHHPHIRLTLARPPASISLPAWFAMSWAHISKWNPSVETLDVDSFTCGNGEASPVPVQADGEWLGHTPMTVTLIPNALRMLIPS